MRSNPRALLAGLVGLLSLSLNVSAQDAAPMARAPVAQPELKAAPAPQTRSAQSNCVREANRRGFVVLDTGNFQQMKDGWSIDMRVRNARGQALSGSCFVETRTGDVNLYGFGWGYDDDGDDGMEFNCASSDMKYRECQLPVNGRARLTKQRSDAPCIEGQTWGQRGDRVWVNNGCRGKFEVRRTGGGSGGGGNNGNLVDCNSDGGRYRECQIGNGYFGRLVRDNSGGRCRENSTWGTRNGEIWVTDGCRGRFERVRGHGGGGGGNGQNFFDCRSNDGRYQECPIGRGYTGRIVREYSMGRCRPGSTWGTREGVVWVTNGCMAQFERVQGGPTIGGSGNGGGGGFGPGSGSNNSAAVAEQACVNEVQRMGGRVQQANAAMPVPGGYRMQMRVRTQIGETRYVACTWSSQTQRVRFDPISGT